MGVNCELNKINKLSIDKLFEWSCYRKGNLVALLGKTKTSKDKTRRPKKARATLKSEDEYAFEYAPRSKKMTLKPVALH